MALSQLSQREDDGSLPLMPPLYNACLDDDHITVTKLLQNQQINVNAKFKPDLHASALHAACKNNNPVIVDMLLKAGADINAPMFNNVTPLLMASDMGHMATVEVLLAFEIDGIFQVNVNGVDRMGKSSLFLACDGGHDDIIRCLLGQGANVSSRDSLGRTALMYAVIMKQPIIIQLLMDSGADPEVSNRAGVYPLHVATRKGYFNIVKKLLANGCNPNVQHATNEWDIPLHSAILIGHSRLVDLLLSNGAKTEMQVGGVESPTALCTFFTSNQCKLDVLNLLLLYGADIGCNIVIVYSSLEMAIVKGWYNVACILIMCGLEHHSALNYLESHGITGQPDSDAAMIMDILRSPLSLKQLMCIKIRSQMIQCKKPFSKIQIDELPLPPILTLYMKLFEEGMPN